MIRRSREVAVEVKEGIRGGAGRAEAREYLRAGDLGGVLGMSVITLEPGATIGEHTHPATEELYFVLAGAGTGVLDSEHFPVGPGDAYVVRAGHSHGLAADPDRPLRFLAVLTRPDGGDPTAVERRT
ncbi:MAG: cupin domain-containing protein [Acidobacteria bacterium]|nr:cupin domain-containing protein [Acidobacteriota bacterium]